MQPSNYQNVPPGELPQPRQDYGPVPESLTVAPGEQQQSQAIEQAHTSPDPTAGLPAATLPLPALPPHLPVSNTAAASQPAGATVSPHSPPIADDGDLIEKEWVTKAKHIVEQTRNDPYAQTNEINKMKADYLKKRYAKDLKLAED